VYDQWLFLEGERRIDLSSLLFVALLVARSDREGCSALIRIRSTIIYTVF